MFKLRPIHTFQRSTKVINNDFEGFEIFSNFVDHGKKIKDNKKNRLDRNNGKNESNRNYEKNRSIRDNGDNG